VELHVLGELALGEFRDGFVDGFRESEGVGARDFLDGEDDGIHAHEASFTTARGSINADVCDVADAEGARGVAGDEGGSDFIRGLDARALAERDFLAADVF
jgi:hypothetical protein